MLINISKEFSATPGARYKNEGKYSGEEFRDEILIPKYEDAKKSGNQLCIELDGGYGYPTSFLEEAFGGLSRIYTPKEVLKILTFISEDEPSLIDEIKSYVINSKEQK